MTHTKLNMVELFAGSRSVGKEAEKLGINVFSVDWDDFDGIDLQADIEFLKEEDIPFIPDIVWASPDCTTYSIAAISTHREKDTYAGKSEYAMKSDKVNCNLWNLITIWRNKNPNLKVYVENPRGAMRKMFFIDYAKDLLGFKQHTVWYCQYGDDRAKPTDIWTNDINWIPRPECHNFKRDKETGEFIKHCHHQSAPRGSRTGTQGRKGSYERSKIPSELCREILISAKETNDTH